MMNEATPADWPVGDGEMTRRIREFTWASTSLGPIDSWTETLRESIDFVLENPAIRCVMWGPEGLQIYNDAYAEAIGDRHPAALGVSAFVTFGDARDAFEPLFRRAWAGESVPATDIPFESKPGSPATDGCLTLACAPVFGVANGVAGVLAQGPQNTERKRIEPAARGIDLRFDALFQNIVDYAIFTMDAEGYVTEWTEGAQRVKGYTAEEVKGQHVSLFYPPEEIAAGVPTRELARAAATGRAERESWRVRKGGERFWANEIATAIRDDRGKLIGFTKISRDLTERRLVEEALRESEERFRAIVETAINYAIFTADTEGRIDGWFAGAEAIFGWTEAEAIGMPMDEAYTEEDQAANVPAQERAAAREHGSAPNVRWHRRKDGSRVFIDGVARARYGPDHQFLGVLKIGQDTTERRLAQQEKQDHDERTRQDLAQRIDSATAELRALSHRLLMVQEEERRRLALELHDEIGQVLTGLGLQLGTATPIDASRLADARRTVAALTEQVRNLSMELRPATLESYGLLPTLRWHFERYQRQTGIAVDLLEEGIQRRFTPAVEITVYRIIQEALTNVARHAESEQVVVQLFADDVALTMSVRDRGRGYDPLSITPGSGLGGIRERVYLLGGTCEIDAEPGDGVALTVELPLADPSASESRQEETP